MSDVTENSVEIATVKPIWFDGTLLESPLELGDNGWLTVLADLKEMPSSLQRVDFYLSQMMAMDQQLRSSGQAELAPQLRTLSTATQSGLYVLTVVD